MPLLEAEPCQFPTDLFRAPNPTHRPDTSWYAIYSRSRMEKTIARHLFAHGVTFYLPLKRKVWRANGRKRTAYQPLFTSYLFLCGDKCDCVRALESNQVSRILPVLDPELVFRELAQVERMLGGEVTVLLETDLGIGDDVVVQDGPFRGFVGRVIERTDGQRFVIRVSFLNCGVSVPLEGWQVKKGASREEP
jgi:transcription antitermination factor NusG